MANKGTLPLRNSLVRKSFGSSHWSGGAGGSNGDENGNGNGGQELVEGVTLIENEHDNVEIAFEIPEDGPSGDGDYALFMHSDCSAISNFNDASNNGTLVAQNVGQIISFNPSSEGISSGTYCFNLLYVPGEDFGTFELEIKEPPRDLDLFVADVSDTEFSAWGSGVSLEEQNTLYVSTSPDLDGDPASIIANAEISSTAIISPAALQVPSGALDLGTEYWFNVIAELENGTMIAYNMNSVTTLAEDITPPGMGGSGVLGGSRQIDSITIEFEKPTDNVTPQEQLEYELYMGGPYDSGAGEADTDHPGIEDYFDTIENVETNGMLVDSGLNVESLTAEDLRTNRLRRSSFYVFNVIVSDQAGNKSVYDGRLSATTPFITVDNLVGVTWNDESITVPSNSYGTSNSHYLPVTATLYVKEGAFSEDSISAIESEGTSEDSTTDLAVDLVATDLNSDTNYHFAVVFEDDEGNKGATLISDVTTT